MSYDKAGFYAKTKSMKKADMHVMLCDLRLDVSNLRALVIDAHCPKHGGTLTPENCEWCESSLNAFERSYIV